MPCSTVDIHVRRIDQQSNSHGILSRLPLTASVPGCTKMSTPEPAFGFVQIEQPLINSIPGNLGPHFEPTYLQYYNRYNAGRLATHQVPIEQYRANPAKYSVVYGREAVPGDGVRWSDLKCPVEGGEITVRVFEPERPVPSPRPVYINYHGGGWVFGGLPVDFDFCKRIVRALDCVVFDVDYRLSPEYKYPIPVNDSIAAFHWVRCLSVSSRPRK